LIPVGEEEKTAVITMLLSEFRVQRVGWALLHFLWQGTAIAIAFAILRRLLGRSLDAQGRYVLACVALTAMTIAPALTFFIVPVAAPVWSVPAADWRGLLPGVVALWLLGVLVFSLRLLGAWRFTARLRSMGHPAPPEWQQMAERIAARVGARQTVRVLISSMVDVPMVIGWLRPAILVPVEFFTGVPVEHIKALLAHEIAHIRRFDYLASMLQSIAEAVLFYHPAVWWISEQIRAERELCCDDIAVAVGGDVLTYARALEELESRQPVRLKTVLAANGGSLVKRIRRLIEPESVRERGNNLPGPGAAWAMVLVWIAGVGVSAVHAAQMPQTPRTLAPVPVTLSPDPLPALASHARNTILFDPFLSAQLQQPAPADGDRKRKEAALRGELETPYKKWLNEDVVYIITDEERNAFRQLQTDDEREQFIEQFWLRRDPTPDTVENEFKQEQYRRIAYANQHFPGAGPGWKSDRGRIYIMFGPPDEIDAHPSGGVPAKAFPFEDWRYRYIQGIGNDVMIEFVDTAGSGEYHMTMDPSEKNSIQPGIPPAANNQFERLQQFIALQASPQVNLDDAIGKLPTYEMLPMQVRVDYLRVTGSSVLANITVRFEARDLKIDRNSGKSNVTVMGEVRTMTRRPVATFKKSFETDAKAAAYQDSIPLAPGPYRLKILARDAISARLGTYEVALDVPHFEEGKLASSSLILADTVARVPVSSLPGAMFTIGGTTVRPRPGNRFTGDEKLGIYLQLYNFRPDETAGKLSGSIEYENDNAGTSEKVMDFSEEARGIADASASQVTVEKLVSLKTFQPGAYTLKVTATDRIGNQTVRQQGTFTVSAASNR
jgi:GWxTD domain-containing protein